MNMHATMVYFESISILSSCLGLSDKEKVDAAHAGQSDQLFCNELCLRARLSCNSATVVRFVQEYLARVAAPGLRAAMEHSNTSASSSSSALTRPAPLGSVADLMRSCSLACALLTVSQFCGGLVTMHNRIEEYPASPCLRSLCQAEETEPEQVFAHMAGCGFIQRYEKLILEIARGGKNVKTPASDDYTDTVRLYAGVVTSFQAVGAWTTDGAVLLPAVGLPAEQERFLLRVLTAYGNTVRIIKENGEIRQPKHVGEIEADTLESIAAERKRKRASNDDPSGGDSCTESSAEEEKGEQKIEREQKSDADSGSESSSSSSSSSSSEDEAQPGQHSETDGDDAAVAAASKLESRKGSKKQRGKKKKRLN
jgi:chromatin remodeling complex protein RSC6